MYRKSKIFFFIPKTFRFLQTYTTNSSPNCWFNVPAARESKTSPEHTTDTRKSVCFLCVPTTLLLKFQGISFIADALASQSRLKTCHRHLFYGVTPELIKGYPKGYPFLFVIAHQVASGLGKNSNEFY